MAWLGLVCRTQNLTRSAMKCFADLTPSSLHTPVRVPEKFQAQVTTGSLVDILLSPSPK